MFEKTYAVENFLCHRNNHLSTRNIAFLMSDIMELNANSYGASAAYHQARNLAWVLTDYEFDIFALPKARSDIIVGTLPYSFKKYFGYRKYQIRDNENTVYLHGRGKFVLIDTVTKKLVQPSETLLNMFTDARREATSLSISKYKPRKEHKLYAVETKVFEAYIDINNHMNNAQYVALAHDFLEKDLVNEAAIKHIKVHYRQEALYNTKLTFAYYREPEGIYVEIRSSSGLHAYVLFHLKDMS